MYTRVNAGQSVVNVGLSGVDDNVVQSDVCSTHATCMQDVNAGQSSVDARMQVACLLHAAYMSIVKYAYTPI